MLPTNLPCQICSSHSLPHLSWWKLPTSRISAPKSWSLPWFLPFSHILYLICQEILLVLPKTISRNQWFSHQSGLNHHHLFFFFLRFFFWCGPFLKSLLNLLQYCFCFMFRFSGHKSCGILAPQPGIEPTPPALEREVLTTGPPGKFPTTIIFWWDQYHALRLAPSFYPFSLQSIFNTVAKWLQIKSCHSST